MIKTVTLTGTEQEVTFAGTHTIYWVQNLGGGDILVGLDPELADGKDDVLIVPSGGAGYVRRDTGVKTVYLSGTGKAQVYGANNAFSPFRATLKGGDDITSDGSAITAGTVDYPLLALNLYGKSTQDGIPTPDVPAPIISVGNNGTLTITTDNNNDIALSATITSGLPLCSIDDIYDELIYNADGTGKIIKRTASVTFDGSQTITLTTINNTQLFVYRAEKRSAIKTLMCNCFTGNNLLFSQNNTCGIDGYTTYFRADGFSTADDFKTFAVSNNLTIVYQLETPYEIELSAAEMAELMQLQTFDGITNIYNDAGAEMRVKVATNPMLSEYVAPILKGLMKNSEAFNAFLGV